MSTLWAMYLWVSQNPPSTNTGLLINTIHMHLHYCNNDVIKLTWGTSSQSSASFMAWLAFCWAFLGSMMVCSGQRPGAMASTRAATRVPSFQSDVRFFTSRSGIVSCICVVCVSVCCACACVRMYYAWVLPSHSQPYFYNWLVWIKAINLLTIVMIPKLIGFQHPWKLCDSDKHDDTIYGNC